MTENARVRKSGPPKLPDFSARASGGPPPIETVAGTPGIDHRPDLQPLDAQCSDHGTAGLAAGHHQAARAGCDQRGRDLGHRLLDQAAGTIAAEPALDGLHLFGRRAGVDQHRPIGHAVEGPGNGLSRPPTRRQLLGIEPQGGARGRHRRHLLQRRRRAGAGQYHLAAR